MQKRNNPAMSVGEDADGTDDPVVKVFEYAWIGLQPVLFAFIGTDLKFELLRNGNMVFLGLIVLAFGLVVRTNTVSQQHVRCTC